MPRFCWHLNFKYIEKVVDGGMVWRWTYCLLNSKMSLWLGEHSVATIYKCWVRISAKYSAVNNKISLNGVGKHWLSTVGYWTRVKYCWHIVRICFNLRSVADGWGLSTCMGRGCALGVKCQWCWRILQFPKSIMWMQIKPVDKNRRKILFWKFIVIGINW